MTRRITLTRWIALTATDRLTIDVDDDWTLADGNPYDHPIVAESRVVVGSTDHGAWELEP